MPTGWILCVLCGEIVRASLMSAGTKIQWCDATVNFWWGCFRISPGCRKCYAAMMALRLAKGRATWGKAGKRWLRVGQAANELVRLDILVEDELSRFRTLDPEIFRSFATIQEVANLRADNVRNPVHRASLKPKGHAGPSST